MKISKVLAIFSLVSLAILGKAQTTCTSTGFSNQWASGFSCIGAGTPIVYIVQAGDSLHVSSNVGTYDSVFVYGVVTFQNGRTISMSSSGVFQIMAGGTVSAGGGGTKISFAGGGSISGTFSQTGPAYANNTGGWYTGYLPVEFMSVEAQRIGEDVHLQWSTASEQNNDFFAVELSSEGGLWHEAGHVRSKAKNGRSVQILDYAFTLDALSADNKQFARIRQVDFNGASSFSEVIELPKAQERPYALIRNSEQIVRLRQDEALPLKVRAYNTMGQLELEAASSSNALEMQLPKSGIYWFEIERGGLRYTEKWLVNP